MTNGSVNLEMIGIVRKNGAISEEQESMGDCRFLVNESRGLGTVSWRSAPQDGG